jgi:hypothetical protein
VHFVEYCPAEFKHLAAYFSLCFYIFSSRAAYKGFADSIRLLLFLDAYRGRQDKEGMCKFDSCLYYL